nr:hypothetical protein [Tanacetum cinerariifolium]
MTTTVVNNSLFRAFVEKQKITGLNFMDWYRNLWIVLSVEDKLTYLKQPIPAMPRDGNGAGITGTRTRIKKIDTQTRIQTCQAAPEPDLTDSGFGFPHRFRVLLPSLAISVPPAGQVLPSDVLNTYNAWVKASKEIAGLMLITMDPDIQKNLEQLGAYDMLKELKRSPSFASKPKNPPTPKKGNPAKDATCHQCGEVGYLKETIGYPFYYSPENKVFITRNAEFFENNLIDQEASRSLKDLEIIQKEDTHSSINTSLNHEEDDQETNESQNDIIPIRKSSRTRCALDRMCLHVVVEEHGLGDLGEPANYKAALLDSKFDKWLNAMNVEMQSMRDNETDMDGAVHTYKARLVAKVSTQTPTIDYKETFFPVADIRAIRILIAIAAFYDYEIWKMDVKTAFLDGYLYEEVCMEQPEGFVNPKYPNRKILKRYFMENSKRGTIPIQEKLKLSKSQGASTPTEKQRMQNIPYASAVGSIMYNVRCTRPDVVFDQNITSRFQQNPGELHWTIVKNIMKYLRNTKDMFLFYGGDSKRELKVSCYTDTGYLTDADDLKSQTGYVFILNGGVVDWKSTKQSIFATSSTGAEYITAFDASKEAVWIHKFISGLDVVLTIEEPINMYCDNTGAITIMKDHGVTKGARHFRPKVYYLRETIEMGDVRIEKVDTHDN